MLKLGTDRARELGTYIVENKATVRAAAKAFGISKSTVHTDVAVKLRDVDFALWQDVRDVLDVNKEMRGQAGGAGTREPPRTRRMGCGCSPRQSTLYLTTPPFCLIMFPNEGGRSHAFQEKGQKEKTRPGAL